MCICSSCSRFKGCNLYMTSMDDPGHIYMCQIPHCIDTGRNIFKVGRTSKGFSRTHPEILNRVLQYPKGTAQLAVFDTPQVCNAERHLLNTLPQKFRRCTEFGNEYFEGDIDEIKECVSATLQLNHLDFKGGSDTRTRAKATIQQEATQSDVGSPKCGQSSSQCMRCQKTPSNITQLYEADAAYELNPNECKYCRYLFTQVCNARRHEVYCKENDDVRYFELKLCIPLDRYHEKDCRFCGKTSSRRYDNLQHRKICKKRKNYLRMLSDRFNL